jgi:FkbM family methyltransferase
MATHAARVLKSRGVDVRGFSDGNSGLWGTKVDGLPVVSPKSIGEFIPKGSIFVASSLHDSAIRENLEGFGYTDIYPMPYLHYTFPEAFPSREYLHALDAPFQPGARDAICRLFDLLADDDSRTVLLMKLRYYLTLEKRCLEAIKSEEDIYFDTQVHSLREDEIVVDGGAFSGDTLALFLRACEGRFKGYYAFEPDPGVFNTLKRAFPADARVNCICAGLFDRTGNLSFCVSGGVDTKITETEGNSSMSLPVVDLSSFFQGKELPTIVKMDIEGS